MTQQHHLVRPVWVTQHNAEAVLGIPHERFLAFLREHPEVPRRKEGKLVIARVADIDRLFEGDFKTVDSDPIERGPRTADEIARSLGLEPTRI